MTRTFGDIFEELALLVSDGRALTGQLDQLIHPGSGGVVTQPQTPPAAPIVLPLPRVAAPPTPDPGFPWVTGVKVTCFGNRADEQATPSEWKATAYGWYACTPGSGMADAFCAVPWRPKRGDGVNIRRRIDGRIVRILIGDGGPWNDASRPDPYMLDGRHPQAETGTDLRGRHTNGAGLDLTPAAWTLINDLTARANWEGSPDGLFDVQWSPADAGHAVTDHEMWEVGPAIRRAAFALVGAPFPYAPGTEDGELGCADVVSTALINAGALDGGELQLSVAGLDQVLRERHGWRETAAPYQDGDVIEWGPRSGQTHSHVGILVLDPTGHVQCINNSSSKRTVILMELEGYDRPVVRVIRAPEASA